MRISLILVAALTMCGVAGAKVHEISGGGMLITVDDSNGNYTVHHEASKQDWSGSLGTALINARREFDPRERQTWSKIEFDWKAPSTMHGSIMLHEGSPSAIFEWSCDEAQEKPPADFPNFTSIPSNLHLFSYSNRTFSPPRFAADQNGGSPFVFFDDQANTTVVSPAANFMTASLHGDEKSSVSSGFVAPLENLPAGFKHRTLVVFDHGINKTFQTWGDALVNLLDVKRPANDADIGLKYLGYWTDNRASYYYRYDIDKGYAGTLLAVRDELKRLNIPIGYLQLDSWWYKKASTGPDGKEGAPKKTRDLPEGSWNKYGGLLEWTAHEDLFPHGLAEYQKQLGLPLITHNRWVDLKSPYREKFQISGIGAVDPKWWDQIADYCKESGIITYEQDWLDRIYNYSPEFQSTPDKGDAFMDNMSRATRERGVTMQYCMLLPRHYLQGAKYANLTSVRVSEDGFNRRYWVPALYVSRLAGSLKEWPWVDVFMSRSTPDLLLATLTAGMVGIGDRLGEFDKENLMLSIRGDGVIVKPDVPITPTDATFLADATNKGEPMIATTYSQHGEQKTAYVFAFPRAVDQSQFHFTAAEIGMSGDVWVYDWKTKTGKKLAPGETYTGTFGPKVTTAPSDPSWAYLIVAPVDKSGIALIGDEGKFSSMGSQRIANMEGTRVTVAFAPGESSIVLHGYADSAPAAPAEFDPASKHFTVNVSPATGQDRVVVDLKRQ